MDYFYSCSHLQLLSVQYAYIIILSYSKVKSHRSWSQSVSQTRTLASLILASEKQFIKPSRWYNKDQVVMSVVTEVITKLHEKESKDKS